VQSNLENNANEFLSGLMTWSANALPNLIAAILILIVGLLLASWVGRLVKRTVENHPRMDNTFAATLSSIARYAIILIVLVATLSQLGFQTTSLIAALGAIGLAIGLALQGTLANIAAGFMLLWLRPFRVGDVIEGGGITGTVREVGLFASELHTYDGVYHFVPNSELWNKRIANYTRLKTRMVDLSFGVSYDDDISAAQQILIALAVSDERIIDEPVKPIAFVSSLDDSSVTIGLRAWVASQDYWPTRRSLTEHGKLELEKAGLTIPFPQIDIHMQNSGIAKT
jgi:small conductance mechanosensitive channel